MGEAPGELLTAMEVVVGAGPLFPLWLLLLLLFPPSIEWTRPDNPLSRPPPRPLPPPTDGEAGLQPPAAAAAAAPAVKPLAAVVEQLLVAVT